MDKKIVKDDSGNQVLPITHVTAVLDNNGNNIQDIVDSTESSLEALSGYFVCETNGSTAAKVVAATNYNLTVGGSLKIKFLHANTVTPTSPATITLSINNQTAKTILYAGEAVTASNTWDDNEIVNVFYDGTNYLAYSVEGGGLLNKQTIPPSSQASEKKGLTEKTISLTVEALQNDIDTIAASSSVVGISGSVARFVQSTEGTTENINIKGTCNPATSIMTLQQYSNDAWGNIATTSPNAYNAYTFTRELLADSDYAYRFRIVNQIRNTEKVTSDSYVYYVRNIYIGTILTSELAITDPEETGYIADFSALINKLSTYNTPTTNARTTYPNVGFDDDARRIVMINPKVNVTNINPDRAYMTSVIDTNRMPFTLVESGSSLDRLMDSNFNIYISDNSYNPGGPRNLIFTN